MWWALIAQLAGSVIGEAMSKMDKDEAMRLIKSVSDEFGRINVPELQKLVLAKQKDTNLAGIKDDPEYRADQSAADAQLNDVISSGGLTLADRAALNAVRNRVSRTESAGRNAITNSMAARGSLDSGNMLAMQLANNQSGAQAASEAGERTTGQAQARMFAAIRERALLAGQGLDRDYRQQSDKARAQDAIEAGNTAIANTAARHNAGIPQQNFDNQMRKTAGAAGATYASAGAHAASAKDTKQTAQGIGNMAGAAGQAAYGASTSGGSGSPPALQNTPDFDSGFGTGGSPGGSDPSEWSSSYGADPNALSGESTRRVIGHRLDGSPIYSEDMR